MARQAAHRARQPAPQPGRRRRAPFERENQSALRPVLRGAVVSYQGQGQAAHEGLVVQQLLVDWLPPTPTIPGVSVVVPASAEIVPLRSPPSCPARNPSRMVLRLHGSAGVLPPRRT